MLRQTEVVRPKADATAHAPTALVDALLACINHLRARRTAEDDRSTHTFWDGPEGNTCTSKAAKSRPPDRAV